MDFQRSRRRRTGLELTPLIDVVFLLLVFLILTANFQMPSMSLDLPGGTTEDESEEQVVIVEIGPEGALAVDSVIVPAENLRSTLEATLAPLTLRAVRLMADESVPYGQLLPVIEGVRAAGAEVVDLVHD